VATGNGHLGPFPLSLAFEKYTHPDHLKILLTFAKFFD
jgi:hypothetical protein